MVEITSIAQKYLAGLLLKQNSDAEIRVFITDAGTSLARCGVCFCFPDSFQSSDVIIDFDCISIRVEKYIIPFLRDSVIDILVNGLDSQLIFRAPHARGLLNIKVGVEENLDNVVLEQKVKDLLELQINPQLSLHGGSVSLVNITEDFLVILKFSGGCNGCAMASRTMQLGIETTLKRVFPQLKGVCDVTEHYRGDHSYY